MRFCFSFFGISLFCVFFSVIFTLVGFCRCWCRKRLCSIEWCSLLNDFDCVLRSEFIDKCSFYVFQTNPSLPPHPSSMTAEGNLWPQQDRAASMKTHKTQLQCVWVPAKTLPLPPPPPPPSPWQWHSAAIQPCPVLVSRNTLHRSGPLRVRVCACVSSDVPWRRR